MQSIVRSFMLFMLLMLVVGVSPLFTQPESRLVIQDTHDGSVLCSSFSPDSKLVATGGSDGKLRIWDLNTGLIRNVFTAFEGEVSDVCFHPEGNLVAVVSSVMAGSTILLYDINENKVVREISFPSSEMDLGRKLFYTGGGRYLVMFLREGSTGSDIIIRFDTRSWEKAVIDIRENASTDVSNIILKKNGNILAFGNGVMGTEFLLNGPKTMHGEVSLLREKLFSETPLQPALSYGITDGLIQEVSIYETGGARVLLSGDIQEELKSFRGKRFSYMPGNLRRINSYSSSPNGQFVALCGGSNNYSQRLEAGKKELVFSVIDVASGISVIRHDAGRVPDNEYVFIQPDLENLTNKIFSNAYASAVPYQESDELSLNLGNGDLCRNIDFSTDEQNNQPLKPDAAYTNETGTAVYGPGRKWLLYNSINGNTPQSTSIVDARSGNSLKRLSTSGKGGVNSVNPKASKTYLAQVMGARFSSVVFGGGDQIAEYDRQPSYYVFLTNYGRKWNPDEIRKLHYEHQLNDSGEIVLKGHKAKVVHLSWDNTGELLLSFDQSGRMKAWREGSWAESFTTKAHNGSVTASHVVESTGQLLTAGTDQQVNSWKIGQAGATKVKSITIGGVANQLALVDNRLYVKRMDGFLEVYDYRSGNLLWELLLKNEGYFIRHKGEYYTYSKDNTPYIAFLQDDRMHPFDVLDLRYNRPDVVLKAIGCTDNQLIAQLYRAYQKRLEIAGVTELAKTAALPKLNAAVQTASVTSEKVARFTLSARPAGSPLSRLLVWVDNCLVSNEKLSTKIASSITANVTLASGPNVIQFAVQDDAGNRSALLTQRIFCSAPKKRNLHFIGVGVAKYNNGQQLAYVDNDIREMARLITSRKKDEFQQVYIDTLINGQATRAAIDALHSRMGQIKEDDAVLLYFSGHGLFDDEMNYYLVPYDGLGNSVKEHCFTYESFNSLLDNVPARDKLMLINACFSGEYDTDPETYNKMMSLFGDVRKENGTTVITSSRSDQSSFTGNSSWGDNSAFGYAVIKGLDKSNDLNEDGAVDITELYTFLSASVTRDTRSRGRRGARQTPTLRHYNPLGNFPLVGF